MASMLGLNEDLDDDVENMINQITGALNKSAFMGDRLISFDKSAAFLKDPKFAAALDKCALTPEDRGRSWRVNTLSWAAKKALSLDGDFVECGVFEGFMSHMLVDIHDFTDLDRTFYLYDTFEGFPTAYSSPEDFPGSEAFWHFANQVYGKAGLHEMVVERFAPYHNVKVIKGIVPDVLHEVSPQQISYLHMDLNSPRAETAGLEILYDRVVSGGVIVFDDYGWDSYRLQMEAADDFMNARGQFVLELPTGQGLVVKN
jgi:O-methyltransferase